MPPREGADRSFLILAVNDIYRIEGVEGGDVGGLARIRALRAERERLDPDLLLLHGGDFLYPSFMSRLYDGAQMVDVMNLLDGDPDAVDPRMFVTFGNHEFENRARDEASILQARLDDSQFYWLGTDISFDRDEQGRRLVASDRLLRERIVSSGGIRVGLFSLSTDVTRPEYVAGFADPGATARAAVAGLRARGAEVVVALTHLERAQDEALLTSLGRGGPDLIIGGHDHERVALQVGGRWVLKADAEARTVTEARVRLRADGSVDVEHRFVELGTDVDEDPAVEARVTEWRRRHEEDFCVTRRGLSRDCLEEVLGSTRTRLGAEELEVRKYETSLGNWVADVMRTAFPEAQVAFINSGSLRLNQDLPAGTPITRRHVEELFAYPAPLRLIEIDGATLREVASRAVQGWSGNGWWLQIAGFAFRHDPDHESAGDLTLLTATGPRPVAPEERLLAVTVDFLVDPSLGQDGYTMLGPDQVRGEGPDLKELVIGELREAGAAGIAPTVEGRICNSGRPGPCRATPQAPGSAPRGTIP